MTFVVSLITRFCEVSLWSPATLPLPSPELLQSVFQHQAAAVGAGALCGHIFVFPEPELRVRDPSRRPTVPGRHLDMLACHRLLKKSADAPEVNENIWFLPDLFTSQLGHMSWQVTRVQRTRRPMAYFPTSTPAASQKGSRVRPCTVQT